MNPFWALLLCPFGGGLLAALPPWGLLRLVIALLALVNAVMFPFWLGRFAAWLGWDALKSAVESWSIGMLFGGYILAIAATGLGYVVGRLISRLSGLS